MALTRWLWPCFGHLVWIVCFLPHGNAFVPLVRTTAATNNDRFLPNMARYQFDYEQDFYFTLNVTRTASPTDIRRNYRLLAKEWHPDKFVKELKFVPETMSTSQLKEFLTRERVGIQTLVEKTELVQKAWETHRRTQRVHAELERQRQDIMDRFALLNEAYSTLYDDEKRRQYNLSGDWGIPGMSGKTRNAKVGMGDREEAARVRVRREAAQRSPVQERVYQQYLKEKEERDQKEAESAKQREERQARELQEKRDRVLQTDTMNDEDRRVANQEKIKAQWGNMFNGLFGGK